MYTRLVVLAACAALMLQAGIDASSTAKPSPSTKHPAATTKHSGTTTKHSGATTKHSTPTTAAPTTKPSSDHQYVVSSKGVDCIIVQTSLVDFVVMENDTVVDADSITDVQATGQCTSTSSYIELSTSIAFSDTSMRLFFELKGKNSWALVLATLYTQSISINQTVSDISAKVGHSYGCGNETFEFEYDGGVIDITLADFQVEALGVKDNKLSSHVERCGSKLRTNNIVPIAVGAALCGLVVCVLVAYLIGRSRSSRRGYQSV